MLKLSMLHKLCCSELLVYFKKLELIQADNLHIKPFHSQGHTTKVKGQECLKMLYCPTFYGSELLC